MNSPLAHIGVIFGMHTTEAVLIFKETQLWN